MLLCGLPKLLARLCTGPIRYRGKKSGPSKQEEAGLAAPARVNAMRNSIGIAMYSEVEMFKVCVSQTDYEFIEVVIRFEVTAAELRLRASNPQLVSAPEEVKACLREALATEYVADTLEAEPFLDGYNGAIDVYATIHNSS